MGRTRGQTAEEPLQEVEGGKRRGKEVKRWVGLAR